MSTQLQVQAPEEKGFNQTIAGDSGQRVTLVDFAAEARCAPCRALAPVLNKLMEELGEQIDVVKIDVDAEPELALKYRIKGIPTLKIIRNGEVLDSRTGVQSYSSLVDFVAPFLNGTEAGSTAHS